MSGKSWQFFGGPRSIAYRLFDMERRRLNRRLVRYLGSKAVPGPASRVLEGGSGPAYASSLLARHPNVRLSVAADLDFEALAEARRRDPSLKLIQADLNRLPFRDGAFDLVWNSSTIEHLDRPEAALLEMRRVTARSGHVFVGVPNRAGALGFQRWIPETRVGRWLGRVFTDKELTDHFRRARLEPVDRIHYWILRAFVGVLGRNAA